MRFAKPSSITLSVLTVSLLGTAALVAPAQAHATGVNLFSYAAKAICEEGNSTVETDVNVHNPRYEEGYFFWKLQNVQQDLPVPATPQTPNKTRIWGDGVISIDCEGYGGEFEGFIVIYSQKPLDVVGVLEVEEDDVVKDMEITPVTPNKIVLPLTTWTLWNNQAT